MKEVNAAQIYTDFSSLNDMKLQAKHNDKDALKSVATQFESVFLEMVLSSARSANSEFNDEMLSSDQMQFMYEMLDQQLAQVLASKGLGFADMIEKQLDKNG